MIGAHARLPLLPSRLERARHYVVGDVFVFPSLTDTFGLVMLEALASGVPVAAYPVQGPLDVIGRDGRGVKAGFNAQIGALDTDLGRAVDAALALRRSDCRRYAELFSWENCARIFVENLVTVHGHRPPLQVAA